MEGGDGSEGRGWIPRSMIEFNGNQLGEKWELEARNIVESKDPVVGDNVAVTFSADSMKRMVRVCAVCNIVTFDANSKKVRNKDIRNKSNRLRYEKMLKLAEKGEKLEVGMNLPFRGRLEQAGNKKTGASVIYPVNQWMDSGENATEAAMVRWAQDKDLFNDDDLEAIKAAVQNKLAAAEAKARSTPKAGGKPDGDPKSDASTSGLRKMMHIKQHKTLLLQLNRIWNKWISCVENGMQKIMVRCLVISLTQQSTTRMQELEFLITD